MPDIIPYIKQYLKQYGYDETNFELVPRVFNLKNGLPKSVLSLAANNSLFVILQPSFASTTTIEAHNFLFACGEQGFQATSPWVFPLMKGQLYITTSTVGLSGKNLSLEIIEVIPQPHPTL